LLTPEQKANEIIQSVKNTGAWVGEIYNVRKDGSKFWSRTNITAFEHNKHGRVFLSMQKDISEQKRTEAELQLNRDLLEKAQRISLIGHCQLNLKTNVFAASDELYRIWGLTRGAQTQDSFEKFIHPDDREKSALAMQRGAEFGEEWDIEHRLLLQDGKIKWVHVIAEPVRDTTGELVEIVGTVQDITQQKLMEESLRSSESRLNDAERLAKIGSWELDTINNKLIWSDQVYHMFDLEPQQFEATYEAFLDHIHPDDREDVNEAYVQSLQDKTTYKIQHRLLLKDDSVKYVKEFCESYFDDNGNPVRSIGMIQDITALKLAEEEKAKLEKQLLVAQRMEAIGTLAGGIAHDFNNILTPIIGYTDIALSQLPTSEPLVENLKQIAKGANRAKELVAQILLFSRQVEKEQIPLKLQKIIREALGLLRASIPATVEIKQKLDDSCGEILADASQMHRIIVNLCANAWQAMEEEGGTLTVELKPLSVNADNRTHAPNLRPGEYAHLSIIDTGIGIDKEVLDNIFEPFFTTKAVDKGTGLGLSVVHGIVMSHHGDIQIDSEPGRGSAFHVYLPLCEASQALNTKRKTIMERGEESILLVDDDADVGGVMKAMLGGLGYKVSLFTNSVEALETLSQASEKYDLVITDLTMPDLTGLELAKQLQKDQVSVPVIIMTGNSSSITEDIQLSCGINKVIDKPIRISALAESVREVLDQRSE